MTRLDIIGIFVLGVPLAGLLWVWAVILLPFMPV